MIQYTRNRRILLKSDFVIDGPEKDKWVEIIQETFSVHNAEQALADYQIVESDIARIVERNLTLGDAIEGIGSLLASSMEGEQNFSEYQVIMMWPVSDSLRNQRVLQFSRPREGYKLNWDVWYNHLNDDDKKQLPIKELNRARLYFDVRVIPVRAADLYKMCTNLNDDSYTIAKTYLDRFKKTHFFHVLMDEWEDYDYNPVRERESNRAKEAESWYRSVTTKPVSIGKRVASALRQCGVVATYEKTITSPFGTVRADIYAEREESEKPKVIIELKVYSPENTMPSSIKDAIKVTLKRHAQFAGFLQRQ